MNAPRERTVTHLQGLYAVVVAIALTLAVDRTLPEGDSIDLGAIPLLVALLVTLVPFYHGTLRHLDSVYIEDSGPPPREGGLLLDFFALFIESCVFLVLGASVNRPELFAWMMFALLTIDIGWAALTMTVFTTRRESLAQLEWLRVNLGAAPAFLAVAIAATLVESPEPFATAGVLALAIARTGLDYWRSWKFYVAAPP